MLNVRRVVIIYISSNAYFAIVIEYRSPKPISPGNYLINIFPRTTIPTQFPLDQIHSRFRKHLIFILAFSPYFYYVL